MKSLPFTAPKRRFISDIMLQKRVKALYYLPNSSRFGLIDTGVWQYVMPEERFYVQLYNIIIYLFVNIELKWWVDCLLIL